MAIARMLHKKISLSRQVNRLSIPARLLFTWMIAHADDEGRLQGEAEYIKALVVPMTDWSFEEVEKYITEITGVGLIHRWETNNDCFIELDKWLNHQQIRKDRFKESLYPTYPNKLVDPLSTNGQPNNNQTDTQYSAVESKVNKAELRVVERSSTTTIAQSDSFKKWKDLPSDPNEFEPETEGEAAAKEVWLKLEPKNQQAFKLTYAKALYFDHLPANLFYEFTSNIKQDSKIRNPGAVFNSKVREYVEIAKTLDFTQDNVYGLYVGKYKLKG